MRDAGDALDIIRAPKPLLIHYLFPPHPPPPYHHHHHCSFWSNRILPFFSTFHLSQAWDLKDL